MSDVRHPTPGCAGSRKAEGGLNGQCVAVREDGKRWTRAAAWALVALLFGAFAVQQLSYTFTHQKALDGHRLDTAGILLGLGASGVAGLGAWRCWRSLRT